MQKPRHGILTQDEINELYAEAGINPQPGDKWFIPADEKVQEAWQTLRTRLPLAQIIELCRQEAESLADEYKAAPAGDAYAETRYNLSQARTVAKKAKGLQ